MIRTAKPYVERRDNRITGGSEGRISLEDRKRVGLGESQRTHLESRTHQLKHGMPYDTIHAVTPESLVYRGDRQFELVEAGAAPLAANEARIEVGAVGICGSDVHGYMGLNDRRQPGTVMGHEVAGRVTEVAAGVDFEIGEVVAVWPIVSCGSCALCLADLPHLCRERQLYGCVPELAGGFATEMVVPGANLVRLPAEVTVELGALVEPLAVGHHAAGLLDRPLGSVGIIGGGPIGIAAAIAATRSGAQSVVVVEPIADRRQALQRIGLTAVAPESGPTSLDTVFECVGFGETVRAALAMSRPGGTVTMIGVAEPEVTIPVTSLVIEERALVGSSAYTLGDFHKAAESLADGRFDFAAMIEARADLEGVPNVFSAYASNATTAIKTIVVPGGV
jgi:threonine dehydrogenase-like Zn-dependent dehydrogenase